MPVTDIGIDLGTATIIVYVKGRGVLYQEPSIAAYDRDANKILAFGTEAEQIIGRTPLALFRPGNDEDPTLLHAGDKLVFYAIDEAEYQALQKAGESA